MKRLIILFAFITTSLWSQDFGYTYTLLTEYRSIGFGYHFQNFRASNSNPLSDTAKLAFSTAMPVIEYRQLNGRLAVGYQQYKDRLGTEREAFSVYGETHTDLALDGSAKIKPSVFIPIVVSANYMRAESAVRTVKSFDIGSLGIGAGLKYRYFERSFGIQASVVGSLYYASEGFSVEYGSQTSLVGEVQTVFSDILFEGIVVGYRYEAQRWNMSSSVLDYQRWYHGGFIGLLF
jgi:hypothetical protein